MIPRFLIGEHWFEIWHADVRSAEPEVEDKLSVLASEDRESLLAVVRDEQYRKRLGPRFFSNNNNINASGLSPIPTSGKTRSARRGARLANH